jgi:replication factor A1
MHKIEGGDGMKISELVDGTKKVEVTATIIDLKDTRETKTKKMVRDATIEDGSGKIVLVLWNEDTQRVGVGDKIKIENGYVSSYQDKPQLNLGKWGTMKIVDAVKVPLPTSMAGSVVDAVIVGLLTYADQFEDHAKSFRQMAEDLKKK